jgi:hypothetical protein
MIRSIPFLVCLLANASAQVVSVADPYSEFPKDKTVVWSPLFQATWDAMNHQMGGKPKKVEPANDLIKRLDSFKWKANEVMPEGRWKTWAGPATPDFLSAVNKEAAQMTGDSKDIFILEHPDPNVLACFGLLDRTVEFEKPFFKSLKAPILFGKNQQAVRFFGVRDEKSSDYESCVKVLANRPVDGSHALEISCKGANDKLVVYMPPRSQDFATACKWLRQWRKTYDETEPTGTWDDKQLHHKDDVRIPYVSLDAKTDFTADLKDGRYDDTSNDHRTILSAQQKTHFMLSEKGAVTRIEADIMAGSAGDPCFGPEPRNFIYDRPFFIFLWRDKAEWPYIGIWVGDTSALQKMN